MRTDEDEEGRMKDTTRRWVKRKEERLIREIL
jgi:hypothetical protein